VTPPAAEPAAPTPERTATTSTSGALLRAEAVGTDRVVVVAPHGALTGDQAPALRRALRGACGDRRLLVLDLIDVPAIDDAVIEVIVGAAARCAAAGTGLVAANAQDQPWLALTRARAAGVVRAHRRSARPLAELLQVLAP
jgi:anti-anti-sigma regulatory factor